MEGQSGLSWVFPSPYLCYALIIIQQVRLWLIRFSLLRTKRSGIFQNGSFPPTPVGNIRRSFYCIYCENLVVNPPKLQEPFYEQIPMEFSTLTVVHPEPPEIQQLQFGFPYASTGSCGSLHSSPVSHDSLYSPVSLKSWGQWFALCRPFSYGFKKSCWCFILFSFLLVIRMDW